MNTQRTLSKTGWLVAIVSGGLFMSIGSLPDVAAADLQLEITKLKAKLKDSGVCKLIGKYVITNLSQEEISAITVSLYLSPQEEISPEATPLDSNLIEVLGPGEMAMTEKGQRETKLKANVEQRSNGQYLIVAVDPDDVIAEDDETNNQAVLLIDSCLPAMSSVQFSPQVGEIRAGETTRFRGIFSAPPEILAQGTAVNSATIDLAASLPSVMVDLLGSAVSRALIRNGSSSAPVIAQAVGGEAETFIRIAPMEDDATVCETGELIGPISIGLDESMEPETVDPPTVSATPPVLSILSAAGFSYCMDVRSPIDAMVTVEALEVESELCEEEPGAFGDTAGIIWDSEFTCSDSCGNTEQGDNTFTITQNGTSASFTDRFDGSGSGSICGDTWKIGGSGPGFTEDGTFTLNDDGTIAAVFDFVEGVCTGTCTDTMTRH